MSVQNRVIDFLSTAAAYGTAGAAPERIDTHISAVFLAGDYVYKLKREVVFDYVDFSTVERRRQACEAEVRLNRRTAPSLYLGVVAVVAGPDGQFALDELGATAGRGGAEAVDWLVKMRRFDQQMLFDRMAEANRLDLELMPRLADAITRLHAGAERRTDHGGAAGMAWVVDGNALGARELRAAGDDVEAGTRLVDTTRAALAAAAPALDARRAGGFVRVCHGDLHLGNICLIDGEPTLFDAIEFNDRISCVDVLYDLAFVLMDLWRRGLHEHANGVFNAYLDRTGEAGGLDLLPLFLSCRASVRAKTSIAAAAVQPDGSRAGALRRAAHDYLALAQKFLDRSGPPRLIAIGGLSGSGKSTLARRLAPRLTPAPGARVVRTDLVRKRMFDVDPLTRLDATAYEPAVSGRVYAAVIDEAARALAAGHTVIADGVFARPDERQAIAAVAAAAGAPFTGIWLEGTHAVLAARIRARRGDPSDATEEVLAAQQARGTGPIEWATVDTGGEVEDILRHVEERLR